MERLARFASRVEKVLSDNSPLILTGVGVAGTVATAVLAGQASFRAAELLRHEEMRRKNDAEYYKEIYRKMPDTYPMTRKDKLLFVWEEYIPTMGVGAVTILAIVYSNRISNRRAAALATAYSLTERAYAQYRDSVREHVGERKAQKIHHDTMQNEADRTPGGSQVIVTGVESLCFDSFSGRFFNSTMETIKKAQNDTNYQMLRDGYASLSDFYSRIGLAPTSMSEEVGWTSDGRPLDIAYSTILAEDGRPAISIDFLVSPVREYWKFG